MKIQIFSDIHLEFSDIDVPQTDADVIVAAGDISLGAEGVAWLEQLGKPTIYVAGNHEYYGGDVNDVQRRIDAATADSQVAFLECSVSELDGVRFLDATLWTDFLGANERLMELLPEHMNDYQQINFHDASVTPQDLLQIHRDSRAWLNQELARDYSGKTVVVTHHAPLYASWHAAENSILKVAYCNDLSQLILAHDIDLWIHGHVHARSDYQANNLRVVCNPRGYAGYQVVEGFDPSRTVTLQ